MEEGTEEAERRLMERLFLCAFVYSAPYKAARTLLPILLTSTTHVLAQISLICSLTTGMFYIHSLPEQNYVTLARGLNTTHLLR